jgi:hypothetical protein
MRKFNHLNVPNQFQHYWTKYPEGYTILEALLNWVGQVDNMVDNQNDLNKQVVDYGLDLTDFVNKFDDNLQGNVKKTLSEWQKSGLLDVVISEALQTQIDNVSDQLELTKNELVNAKQTPILKYGNVELPSNFKPIPFDIMKVGDKEYTHNASRSSFKNWGSATNIYISKNGTTSSGLDQNSPITFTRFTDNLANSVYSGDTFILNVLDNFFDTSNALFLTDYNIDVLVRSASSSGYTWIGRVVKAGQQLTNWEPSDGVYKGTQTNNYLLIDAVNVSRSGKEAPRRYDKVRTLLECQQRRGTFYQNGMEVHVNPRVGDNINDIGLTVDNSVTVRIRRNSARILVFENIGFLSNSYEFTFDNVNSRLAFFHCKFYRGKGDALSINGRYQVFSLDCEAINPSKDGYNYHSISEDSLAVEVNCIAYGAGQYKLLDGQQTTNSNNGSTAHDGMYMLRVGCKYWDCEGPIVADVNDCYSISIGCSAINQLDTSTGVNASFYFDNQGVTTEKNPKYVIDCEGYGADFGIRASGVGRARYMGFRGNTIFNTTAILPIDYNKIKV